VRCRLVCGRYRRRNSAAESGCRLSSRLTCAANGRVLLTVANAALARGKAPAATLPGASPATLRGSANLHADQAPQNHLLLATVRMSRRAHPLAAPSRARLSHSCRGHRKQQTADEQPRQGHSCPCPRHVEYPFCLIHHDAIWRQVRQRQVERQRPLALHQVEGHEVAARGVGGPGNIGDRGNTSRRRHRAACREHVRGRLHARPVLRRQVPWVGGRRSAMSVLIGLRQLLKSICDEAHALDGCPSLRLPGAASRRRVRTARCSCDHGYQKLYAARVEARRDEGSGGHAGGRHFDWWSSDILHRSGLGIAARRQDSRKVNPT
jgi:hypothetical protein